MKLEHHEIHSALWLKLKAHIEDRIDSLRKQNDGDRDEKDTAKLRGRIAEAKALLALGESQPPAQVADDGI